MRTFFGLIGVVGVLSACGGSTTVEPGSGGGAGEVNAGGNGAGAGATGGTGAVGASGGAPGTGGIGGAGATCNPNAVSCDLPAPACPIGEVPSVDGTCWGPCVPILTCATQSSCDGCDHGFCVEYQAFTVEYRCVQVELPCSATTCECLAPYFCVDPFNACVPGTGDAILGCACPTC